MQTLICDATGDAELLRAIWPELETDESVQGWQQLPRPKSVRVFQCVDRSISKWAVAVEGKNPKEIERKIDGARRLYAALLMRALEYGGADVGVIVYKITREWIEQNCFVPEWMKLVHWGDVTGTNALEKVRALFVIGRPLASPEDVTRMTEALFGAYVPEREYVVRKKRGRIPIVPDAAGNNTVRVDVREHPHPLGQRVARQITEGRHDPSRGTGPSGATGRRAGRSICTLDGRPRARAGPGRAGAVERAGGRARRADAGYRRGLARKQPARGPGLRRPVLGRRPEVGSKREERVFSE